MNRENDQRKPTGPEDSQVKSNLRVFERFVGGEEFLVEEAHAAVDGAARRQFALLAPVDAVGDDEQRVVLSTDDSERVRDRVACRAQQRCSVSNIAIWEFEIEQNEVVLATSSTQYSVNGNGCNSGSDRTS